MPRLTNDELAAVLSVLESPIHDILGIKPEDTEAVERAIENQLFPDYSDLLKAYLKLKVRYQ